MRQLQDSLNFSNLTLRPISIGENVKLLVDRPDGSYCFRLHKDRVYYVRLAARGYQRVGVV